MMREMRNEQAVVGGAGGAGYRTMRSRLGVIVFLGVVVPSDGEGGGALCV